MKKSLVLLILLGIFIFPGVMNAQDKEDVKRPKNIEVSDFDSFKNSSFDVKDESASLKKDVTHIDNEIKTYSGVINTIGVQKLKENFKALQGIQKAIKEFPDSRIGVEGHTDSFGSDKKNLELSQQRADAVTQYLLANMEIDRTKITSIGYGETKPIANNETKDGRAKNRRIDLKLHID